MSTTTEAAVPVIVFDLAKSHISAYTRTTKTGKVVPVVEHEDSRMSHAQPAGPGRQPAARVSPKGHDQHRIPTRLVTSKKAAADVHTDANLNVNHDAMKEDKKLYEKNVGLTRAYDHTPEHIRGAKTDEAAEHFIGHVKDNLLFLHDQIDEKTRNRSKLWYDGARKITDKLAGETGMHHASIAGALAALSPQKDWYQNVSCARRVIDVVQNKQDHRFDEKMAAKMQEIPALMKPEHEEKRNAIAGKAFGELERADHKAMWLRIYDETYNDKSFPIITPEGDDAEKMKSGSGADRKFGWGSLNEIGKAITCLEANGDLGVISQQMGGQHKVRNFYNNIIAPNASHGDVTIDTHAVAAGLLSPMSGNDTEVTHNFGGEGAAGSNMTGVSGTYGLYAEAYQRAAKERGILPREMQSITWEAVRGLFKDKFKSNKKNVAAVRGIWQQYSQGKIKLDEARQQIVSAAGGIEPPTWHEDHPSKRDAGSGEPGVGRDEGGRGSADAGGVRGAELDGGEDRPGSDRRGLAGGAGGAAGAEAGGSGRGGAGKNGAGGADQGSPAGDFSGGPREVEPEAPKSPSVVLEHNKEYEFEHRHSDSGVAVRARGKLSRWGTDGATMISKDGQEHKVPWGSLSKQDQEAIQSQQKPATGGKARSMKKAEGQPVLVFAKAAPGNDGGDYSSFGEVAGVPVVVFGMAMGAAADAAAQAHAQAPAAPYSGANVPADKPAAEGPEEVRDARAGYVQQAVNALRNFWKTKG